MKRPSVSRSTIAQYQTLYMRYLYARDISKGVGRGK
jgi:hypothetical protein